MKKIILILTAVLISGCSIPEYQIAFPEGNNPSTFKKYDILEGPYTVRVARTFIVKNSINPDGSVRSKTHKSSTDNISYQLKEYDDITWFGQGQITGVQKDGEDSDFGSCKALSASGDGEPIEIGIQSTDDFDVWYKGYVTRGKLKLDLESTHKVVGKQPLVRTTVGYYVYHNGRLVAVIKGFYGGALYISETLKPELLPLVLNAFAFIMSYCPPDV